MQLPQIVEVKGIRVLTSRQIAKAYGVEEKHIKQNFANNRKRYIEGKHYVTLQNQALREFKNKVENFDLVGRTANRLYLWTEKGALLHAKSLNTDKAWEVYDYLVDFYFHTKEQPQMQQTAEPRGHMVVNVPDNPEILQAMQQVEDDMTCMRVLLNECKKYISEEEYQKRSKSMESVLAILMKDISVFSGLKPQLVPIKY